MSKVVVIGAGPAGLAAALAAAEGGAEVDLIDEYARLGGQFFKRAASAFSLKPEQMSREFAQGEALRRAVDQDRIRVLANTLVWGAFDGTLMIYRDGRSEAVEAGAVVLANGAYDRPVPFPGWTLPGVMTAGGAQSLARTQWVLPGRRMVLAGAGPFLLPVARQLLRAGVDIVAIVEATRPRLWLPGLPTLWGQWPRMAEAWEYWRSLRRARVPILYGHKIVRAEGSERVEAVSVSKVDDAWRAVQGSERRIEVDAVATGYGFLPNTELAELMGCALRWDGHAATWFVACDGAMATSLAGVFAAGEITGIGGSAVALEEGRLAGIAAARHVGALTSVQAEERCGPPRARLAGRQRFATMLNEVFAPGPGLWDGVAGQVTVCRCEEVTADEILTAVRNGCASPKEVKDWTRAGMGSCQGRMCSAVVAQLIAREKGSPTQHIQRPHVRPPVKPVPLRALAETELPDMGER